MHLSSNGFKDVSKRLNGPFYAINLIRFYVFRQFNYNVETVWITKYHASGNKGSMKGRRSFQGLSKSAFDPIYGALVRPHLENGIPVCSTNLVSDINHV